MLPNRKKLTANVKPRERGSFYANLVATFNLHIESHTHWSTVQIQPVGSHHRVSGRKWQPTLWYLFREKWGMKFVNELVLPVIVNDITWTMGVRTHGVGRGRDWVHVSLVGAHGIEKEEINEYFRFWAVNVSFTTRSLGRHHHIALGSRISVKR